MDTAAVNRNDAAKNIRTNLQARLNALGWSRYRLAQESGESEQLISGIFNKNSVPRIDVLANMATALGTTVDELIAEPVKNSRKSRVSA